MFSINKKFLFFLLGIFVIVGIVIIIANPNDIRIKSLRAVINGASIGTEAWNNPVLIQAAIKTEDTCTCPGLNQNWEIDMGGSCSITTNCKLGTGNLTFVGTGTTLLNATISSKNIKYPAANQTLKIGSNALLLQVKD